MRAVLVNPPLAIMLGLAGPSTAFLTNIRPTSFRVPADKYHAAVSHCRARPRVVTRNMRIMSSAVDVEAHTDEVASPEGVEVPAAEGVDIPEALEGTVEVRAEPFLVGFKLWVDGTFWCSSPSAAGAFH